MKRYMLAVDQSTSSTKAILFDDQLLLVARSDCAHQQIYPQPGWVEHDPEEIYQNLLRAVRDVVNAAGIDKAQICCLSISNQRETTLLWDGRTGKPTYNAIVWQCARAAQIAQRPCIADMQSEIAHRTGLVLSPYFCAAKAAWIVENVDTAGQELLFGTVDAWLIWKLTGKHRTDYSNASRTMLFNINTLQWDKDLIRLFGLQNVQFPEVCFSDSVFGMTTLEGFFDSPIPVAGVLGDSHGAMFGQQCWERGMAKATFGTGTSVMMNIGEQPAFSSKGLATSIAWGMSGRVEYVFEGNINATGDTLKWLENEVGILPDAQASEEMATKVPSSEGVYLVPAFTGLGAPHYASNARALLCGLSRNSSRCHIVRAALEAIAYQIRDVVDPMLEDAGTRLEALRVDGGPTNNAFLMQFVSDIIGVCVVRNQIEELSALGAASAGGLACGVFASREDIRKLRKSGRTFEPKMPREEADALYAGWQRAVRKACD